MDPTQPMRDLLSSVWLEQDGGPPSIFNALLSGECPWLAYTTLNAEQQYDMDSSAEAGSPLTWVSRDHLPISGHLEDL